MSAQFDAVVSAVCGEFDVSRETLLGPDRSHDVAWARHVLQYALHYGAGWTTQDISKQLARTVSGVNHSLQVVSDRIRVVGVDRESVALVLARVPASRRDERARAESEHAVLEAVASIEREIERLNVVRAQLQASLWTLRAEVAA